MLVRHRAWFFSIGLFVILSVITVLTVSPIWSFLSSPDQLRAAVQGFGWTAPVIVVVLHAAQVIVAPIPGQAIDIANGYLFGWWLGLLISLAGLGLGTVTAIWLAKQFGRPVVESLITPKGLHQVRAYIRRGSQLLFFFLFLLPGTPDDLLCFAIGLSSIPLGRAFTIAMLGRIPGVAVAVLTGATGQSLNPLTFSLVAAAVSLAVFLVVWKTPLGEKINLPKLTATK